MSVLLVASGRAITTMAANNELAASPQRNPRDNVMTGSLPDDFLRLDGQGMTGAVPIQQQQPMMFGGYQQQGGILNITVVQARLAKNYGVTRMDPYCRIRVGMQVFETPTSYNGSKSPRWNKLIQCHIPDSVKEFYMEIYDERTFSIDERIAWGMISIKDEVFSGEVVDDWYSVTGKQGDDKEGLVNIVLQYRKTEGAPLMMGGPMMTGVPMMYQPPMMYPGGNVMYGYPPMMYAPQVMGQSPPQQPIGVTQPPVPQLSEKDIQTLKEMCPDLDDEIIKSVLQQSSGNLDRAAAQLLEMSAAQ